MNLGLAVLVTVIAGYLIGGIPWGLLLGKMKGVDVRQHGSGKVGATNILRTLGVKYAVLVLALDLLKGIAIVLLARLVADSRVPEATGALAALAGHNWSPYIRFHGGRGVTPGIGALFVMAPWVALSGAALGVIVIAVSRYVSLGSILGTSLVFVAMPVLALLKVEPWEYAIYGLLGSALVIFQHRDNMVRLLKKRERKLGERAESTRPIVRKGQVAPQ